MRSTSSARTRSRGTRSEQDLQRDVGRATSTSRRARTSPIRRRGAFFDLYSARVALRERDDERARSNDTLYTLNKGRFEVGKIGENDLLQSELALLRARDALDGATLDFDRALGRAAPAR